MTSQTTEQYLNKLHSQVVAIGTAATEIGRAAAELKKIFEALDKVAPAAFHAQRAVEEMIALHHHSQELPPAAPAEASQAPVASESAPMAASTAIAALRDAERDLAPRETLDKKMEVMRVAAEEAASVLRLARAATREAPAAEAVVGQQEQVRRPTPARRAAEELQEATDGLRVEPRSDEWIECFVGPRSVFAQYLSPQLLTGAKGLVAPDYARLDVYQDDLAQESRETLGQWQNGFYRYAGQPALFLNCQNSLVIKPLGIADVEPIVYFLRDASQAEPCVVSKLKTPNARVVLDDLKSAFSVIVQNHKNMEEALRRNKQQ